MSLPPPSYDPGTPNDGFALWMEGAPKPSIWCRLGLHDWISVIEDDQGWRYMFRIGGCARPRCKYNRETDRA